MHDDRFTDYVNSAFAKANLRTEVAAHDDLYTTRRILLAILSVEDPLVKAVLHEAGVAVADLKHAIDRIGSVDEDAPQMLQISNSIIEAQAAIRARTDIPFEERLRQAALLRQEPLRRLRASSVRRAINLAFNECRRDSCLKVNTGHLLVGLIQEDKGLASRALLEAGIDVDLVRRCCRQSSE